MTGAIGLRVLFDNCVPNCLAATTEGHVVASVIDHGWAGLKDRELLDRMAGRYDVLVTIDRDIRHQQRLHDRPFGIVLLRSRINHFADLVPLVPALLEKLRDVKAGRVYESGAASART